MVLQRYIVNIINYDSSHRMQNGLGRNTVLADVARLIDSIAAWISENSTYSTYTFFNNRIV